MTLSKISSSLAYRVIYTEKGEWYLADGSDFAFMYLQHDWTDDAKSAMKKAWHKLMQVPELIKNAVKETSGQEVVEGLYLLNKNAMIKAMNTIKGMAQTSDHTKGHEGEGTVSEINKEFFQAILSGLKGDISDITKYLDDRMGKLQVQTKKSKVTENFGTVMGLLSLMPGIEEPVISFRYAFSTSEVSSWFVDLVCGSMEVHKYKYDFVDVGFSYYTPEL